MAVVGDGFSGSVRELTNAAAGGTNRVPLNFDAFPVILSTGKIRLSCTIQYNGNAGTSPGPNDARALTDIRQTLVVILDSGKPLVVSQATDPSSDRRVTVEVMATVLK